MPILNVRHGRTQISKPDLHWALGRRWHIGDTGYVKTYSGTPGSTPLRMHRLVMERVVGRTLQPNEFVDHINHDKLDNRRSNLRVVTKSQNGMNLRPRGGKSRYLGVGFKGADRRKCWFSYINIEGKRWYIGNFATEEEAAWMRDQYALALHGDFASLNFVYLPVVA